MSELAFEKPIAELKQKIQDIQNFSKEKGIDLSGEILKLEDRLKDLEQEIYIQLTPWQKTQIARHAMRPTTLDYISALFTDFIELHGDRLFGEDRAIVAGIGMFADLPVTVIGHQKGKDTKDNIARNFGMPHPEGYRKALRLMQQADKFNRPIICFIDTPGAYPGMAAEERGQSEAIARNLKEMAGFGVPIICVVTGEGGSGGALALGVGNRIYMLENSIYSVISPEGAAALLWKDASLAQKAAETMKITAKDLLEMKIIDGIIAEPRGGAHRDKQQTALNIGEQIKEALNALGQLNRDELIEDRYRKFKQIGSYQTLSERDLQRGQHLEKVAVASARIDEENHVHDSSLFSDEESSAILANPHDQVEKAIEDEQDTQNSQDIQDPSFQENDSHNNSQKKEKISIVGQSN